MHLSSLAIAGGSLFLLVLLFKIFKEFRSPLNNIPGPWYARFTNAVSTLHMFRGKKYEWLHDLSKVYGNVVRVGPNTVFLADPDDVRHVFTLSREFNKGAWFDGRGGEPGLITQRDYAKHAARRRKFGHLMSNTELKKYQYVMEQNIDLMMRRIVEDCQSNGVVDFRKWMVFEAADVMGHLCFGQSLHMLETGKKNDWIVNLENIMFMESLRLDLPWVYYPLKWSRLSPLSKVDMEEFNSYPLRLLDRLRVAIREGEDDAQRTLFTPIMQDEKQGAMADHEILAQAGELLFAGSDTTSSTVTWLIWLVLKHPDVHSRLVKELADLPEDYQMDTLDRLPYMNSVLSETLRLYGAASGPLPRECTVSGHMFQGHFVPQGTDLEVQTHTAHRSPKYFPEPEKFLPDRWLNIAPDAKACYLPFGGGPRTCLGIHLAYLHMRLIIVKFFTSFPNARLDEKVKDEDMDILSYVVNTPVAGTLFIHV